MDKQVKTIRVIGGVAGYVLYLVACYKIGEYISDKLTDMIFGLKK